MTDETPENRASEPPQDRLPPGVAVAHAYPVVAAALGAMAEAAGARPAALADAALVIADAAALEDVALAPGVRLALLIERADARLVAEARRLGAMGALPLDMGARELGAAVGALVQGRSWWPIAAERRAAPDGARLDLLSGQQYRVLDLMSRGRLNKQIAWDLGISEGTVKSHVSSILRKLGVERRTQAIATFITAGDRGSSAFLPRVTHMAR